MNSASSAPDIAYAATDDGVRLPVIDITQPAFALPDAPASLAALGVAYRKSEQRYALVPRFVMNFMMRSAARRSRLLADILDPDTSFLAGLTTYIMKLPAETLPPPFDSETDRRIVSSPQVTAMRLRLRQVATLLADALEPLLAANAAAQLVLINIAGGPAIDSLNALILLRRRNPALSARPIAIHVLDIDAAGPHFGAAALAALSAAGQPLAGLDVTFTHQSFDWNAPAPLAGILGRAAAQGAIIAASSEGGLFEYGSDQAIVANLKTLHDGAAKVVVGSVTNADPVRRRSIIGSRFKLLPRGFDGFQPLAERGGFRIARSEPTPLGDQVLLAPV